MMNQQAPENKIIKLASRLEAQNGRGDTWAPADSADETRVLAVTSGKGGVGKTNVVANLGYAISKLGKRVMILDADLGLGNLDILLGIAPQYNLSHVIRGKKSLDEIVVAVNKHMFILPASSGIQEITSLSKSQRQRLFSDLDRLTRDVDVLLIDTAAGISSNVMLFNSLASENIVVATPEPTSITDAYALMKVLSLKYQEKAFKVLVNMAADDREADEVFRQLDLVASRFLDIELEYVGHIPRDAHVTQGVRRQKLVCQMAPEAKASRCFKALAQHIWLTPAPVTVHCDGGYFWSHMQKHFD